MGTAQVIALILLAGQTLAKMQAEGRATTTAEEDAALASASTSADAAHAAEQA